MKSSIVISLIISVIGFVTPTYAETDHSHSPVTTATMDKRIAIKLPAKAKLQILSDMRKHLEIVQGIVAALAKEDFKQVAGLASQLGHMEHSDEVMKRRKMMPEGYRSMGPKMHLGFQAIARDAKDFGSTEHTLEQLSAALNVCTACHQTYKLNEISSNQSTHDSID